MIYASRMDTALTTEVEDFKRYSIDALKSGRRSARIRSCHRQENSGCGRCGLFVVIASEVEQVMMDSPQNLYSLFLDSSIKDHKAILSPAHLHLQLGAWQQLLNKGQQGVLSIRQTIVHGWLSAIELHPQGGWKGRVPKEPKAL